MDNTGVDYVCAHETLYWILHELDQAKRVKFLNRLRDETAKINPKPSDFHLICFCLQFPELARNLTNA